MQLVPTFVSVPKVASPENAERGKERMVHMVDTNALKGIIVAKGMTQQEVAKKIGISPKTFYHKMQKGIFGSDEMESMIDFLSIENPMAVFFAASK